MFVRRGTFTAGAEIVVPMLAAQASASKGGKAQEVYAEMVGTRVARVPEVE